MAIGCLHTCWLFRLAARGVFSQGTGVLDLGPQDIQVSQEWLAAACDRHFGRIPATFARLFDNGQVRRDGQAAFYGLFGAEDYRSADLTDDRADYRFDFNHPPPHLPQFDVVTDFGTMEHVFDIAQILKTAHQLVKPGGYILHVVPSFAFPNHGFYTINPNLLVEFVRANHYRMVDFCYLDNMFVREQLQSKRVGEVFDFDDLPIRLDDMQDTQRFMTKVVTRFAHNLAAPETRFVLSGLDPAVDRDAPYPSERYHLCFVFDLLFVAMQKPQRQRAIVAPIQNLQGVAPLSHSTDAGDT